MKHYIKPEVKNDTIKVCDRKWCYGLFMCYFCTQKLDSFSYLILVLFMLAVLSLTKIVILRFQNIYLQIKHSLERDGENLGHHFQNNSIYAECD